MPIKAVARLDSAKDNTTQLHFVRESDGLAGAVVSGPSPQRPVLSCPLELRIGSYQLTTGGAAKAAENLRGFYAKAAENLRVFYAKEVWLWHEAWSWWRAYSVAHSVAPRAY